MTIREILSTSKTIAVVGLSDRRFRPSHGVWRYMARHGEKCHARLEDVPVPVDVVDIFGGASLCRRLWNRR
jgi:predicted CoA-binding protein